MRGSTSVGYDQFETSPEAIEQELRPAVCERRPTDRLKANYSIDYYNGRVSQQYSKRPTMLFADDLVICEGSRLEVEQQLDRWRELLEGNGLRIKLVERRPNT